MIHHFHLLLFACTTSFLLLHPSTSAAGRHPLSYNDDPIAVEPWLTFENPRLENAYIALQSWKESILSDPKGFTSDWVGPDPCNYTGVFCWPAPDNPCERTVAGVDLNHADIAGRLPHELGLLYDLAFLHLNSNRFCGPLPHSLTNLRLLHELDLSNNRLAGPFPARTLLGFPSLKYLDVRFNELEGPLPSDLFEKDFDAIFLNDNRFKTTFPDNIGKSSVSVIVMANNELEGCLPPGLGDMAGSLRELIVTNTGLESCFPSEIGKLGNLTVLDLSRNRIRGPLPDSVGEMASLEQLNLGGNLMSESVSEKICGLRKLERFVYKDNFFTEESAACLDFRGFEDKMNCIRGRPHQRTEMECRRFLSRGVNCSSVECRANSEKSSSPSPPPPRKSMPGQEKTGCGKSPPPHP